MQNSRPLLTIAIPTYNRSRYLARLLDSLILQLEQRPSIEIVISDNASPDDTPAVLERFAARGMHFRAFRNATNLGADGNILACFSEANGKYVWIVGDDDVLLPGSVAGILQLLSEDDFDVVHVRAKDIVVGGAEPAASVAGSLDVEIIKNPRAFLRKTHVYLTFISGNVVNKERVMSLPHQPFSQLVGTSLLQLGWTYTLVRHFRQGAYVNNPLVAAGSDDRGGYRLFEVFGTNLKRVTEEWLVTSELTRLVLNGTIQTFFPGFVLRSRLRKSEFLEEDPDALLRSLFSSNYRYYLFLQPLLRWPLQFARAWFLVCRVVNRLDKLLGNPMLG